VPATRRRGATRRPPRAPAGERSEGGHGGGGAGDPAERGGPHVAGVLGAHDRHAKCRDGGGAGALKHAGRQQHLVGRRKRAEHGAGRHQADADEQGEPDPGEVGDAAVHGGRDGEHECVDGQHPGAAAGGEAEVVGERGKRDGDGGAAHAGQPEQQPDERCHAAGVRRRRHTGAELRLRCGFFPQRRLQAPTALNPPST
jgi:hypothetical protein